MALADKMISEERSHCGIILCSTFEKEKDVPSRQITYSMEHYIIIVIRLTNIHRWT